MLSRPEVLIAMNEISLRKFAAQIAPGGTIIYGREQLPDDFSIPQAQVVCIPASEIADKLGSAKVANVVMMGALLEETECLSPATAMQGAGSEGQESGPARTRPQGARRRATLH